ncbi:MAG TPA: phage holin [Candidatus Scatomorpha gallistercoris]|nr:phage holin [Candidatus Scatomorpha gallistercoris]
MINWLVRFKNKGFWLSFIPAVLLFVQTAVALFGLNIELEGLAAKLLDVMNALFAVLALLGIVNDPTTEGVGDSAQALGYTEPKRAG